MKKHPFRANRSEFADLAVSNIVANVHQCICDCKQAIDMGYKPKSREDLLIKHIQELATTSHKFIGSKCFTLVGGGLATIDRLLTVSLVLEQL